MVFPQWSASCNLLPVTMEGYHSSQSLMETMGIIQSHGTDGFLLPVFLGTSCTGMTNWTTNKATIQSKEGI